MSGNTDLVRLLKAELLPELPEKITWEETRLLLINKINDLINNDFQKLVYYLYRIDVDENRMRALLDKKEGENAAELISDLIIERKLKKIENRKKYSGKGNPSNEEKW